MCEFIGHVGFNLFCFDLGESSRDFLRVKLVVRETHRALQPFHKGDRLVVVTAKVHHVNSLEKQCSMAVLMRFGGRLMRKRYSLVMTDLKRMSFR